MEKHDYASFLQYITNILTENEGGGLSMVRDGGSGAVGGHADTSGGGSVGLGALSIKATNIGGKQNNSTRKSTRSASAQELPPIQGPDGPIYWPEDPLGPCPPGAPCPPKPPKPVRPVTPVAPPRPPTPGRVPTGRRPVSPIIKPPGHSVRPYPHSRPGAPGTPGGPNGGGGATRPTRS